MAKKINVTSGNYSRDMWPASYLAEELKKSPHGKLIELVAMLAAKLMTPEEIIDEFPNHDCFVGVVEVPDES